MQQQELKAKMLYLESFPWLVIREVLLPPPLEGIRPMMRRETNRHATVIEHAGGGASDTRIAVTRTMRLRGQGTVPVRSIKAGDCAARFYSVSPWAVCWTNRFHREAGFARSNPRRCRTVGVEAVQREQVETNTPNGYDPRGSPDGCRKYTSILGYVHSFRHVSTGRPQRKSCSYCRHDFFRG